VTIFLIKYKKKLQILKLEKLMMIFNSHLITISKILKWKQNNFLALKFKAKKVQILLMHSPTTGTLSCGLQSSFLLQQQ